MFYYALDPLSEAQGGGIKGGGSFSNIYTNPELTNISVLN